MPDLSTALLSNTGLVDTVGSVLFANKRSIMGIVPNVTIEEHHTDEMVITDHPVETGTAISDHAYKMPAELTMHVGWSESSDNILSPILGGATSLILLYEAFQTLQSNKVLLIVSTGKRLYTNMLIKSLGVVTDEETENALEITIGFKFINVTSTQTTTISINQVADPAATAPTTDAGTVVPKPAESLLYRGAQGAKGLAGSVTSLLNGITK